MTIVKETIEKRSPLWKTIFETSYRLVFFRDFIVTGILIIATLITNDLTSIITIESLISNNPLIILTASTYVFLNLFFTKFLTRIELTLKINSYNLYHGTDGVSIGNLLYINPSDIVNERQIYGFHFIIIYHNGLAYDTKPILIVKDKEKFDKSLVISEI